MSIIEDFQIFLKGILTFRSISSIIIQIGYNIRVAPTAPDHRESKEYDEPFRYHHGRHCYCDSWYRASTGHRKHPDPHSRSLQLHFLVVGGADDQVGVGDLRRRHGDHLLHLVHGSAPAVPSVSILLNRYTGRLGRPESHRLHRRAIHRGTSTGRVILWSTRPASAGLSHAKNYLTTILTIRPGI